MEGKSVDICEVLLFEWSLNPMQFDWMSMGKSSGHRKPVVIFYVSLKLPSLSPKLYIYLERRESE